MAMFNSNYSCQVVKEQKKKKKKFLRNKSSNFLTVFFRWMLQFFSEYYYNFLFNLNLF